MLIKLGDVIELGAHKLMCGDSLVWSNIKNLLGGQAATMMFTDPPYGIDYIPEPNKWILYSRYLWEQHYGPIPEGMLIHHKDGDRLNDVIENYALKSRAEHLNEHRRKDNVNSM